MPAESPPEGDRLFRDALLGYAAVLWILQGPLIEPAAALVYLGTVLMAS